VRRALAGRSGLSREPQDDAPLEPAAGDVPVVPEGEKAARFREVYLALGGSPEHAAVAAPAASPNLSSKLSAYGHSPHAEDLPVDAPATPAPTADPAETSAPGARSEAEGEDDPGLTESFMRLMF